MVKIGNTSFDESVIGTMTFKQFEKTYKSILIGQDLKEVYKQIVPAKTQPDDDVGKANGLD